MAAGICTNSRGLYLEFKTIKSCARFLIKRFIMQGGRCFFTNIPMSLKRKSKYKISPERLDPTEGYTRNNIALIIIELNVIPPGQYRNNDLTEKQRKEEGSMAKFNQEYWDKSTKMTPEIRKICNAVCEYSCSIICIFVGVQNVSPKWKRFFDSCKEAANLFHLEKKYLLNKYIKQV